MAEFATIDACGQEHCVIFQDDTPERRARYQRHIARWSHYACGKEYRDTVAPRHWPVWPIRIVVSPQPHEAQP